MIEFVEAAIEGFFEFPYWVQVAILGVMLFTASISMAALLVYYPPVGVGILLLLLCVIAAAGMQEK